VDEVNSEGEKNTRRGVELC